MIVLSLVLAPFGMSWFSGALQVVLIGVVLELAGIVRSHFMNTALVREDFATSASVQDDTQDMAEGQLPR